MRKLIFLTFSTLIINSCVSNPIDDNRSYQEQIEKNPKFEEQIRTYKRDSEKEELYKRVAGKRADERYTVTELVKETSTLGNKDWKMLFGYVKLRYLHRIKIQLNCGPMASFQSLQSVNYQKLAWKISEKFSDSTQTGGFGEAYITFEDTESKMYPRVQITYKDKDYSLELIGANLLEVNADDCK